MQKKERIKMEHICKSFSGVDVIKDVELVLYTGEVLGIVGENGAGKSTLMNLLTGVYSIDAGSILFEGEPFCPRNPLDAQIKGISFVHQELDLFDNLTVLENLFIECLPTRMRFFKDKKKMYRIAHSVVDRIGGVLDLNTIVRDLEIGKKQLLEIAKAISKNAQVIIFDEPTTSLSISEKKKVFELIDNLCKGGTSILYISHNLEEVLCLSNRIMVMRDGRNVATLENKGVSRDMLVQLMIGREVGNIFQYHSQKLGKVALEVCNIYRDNIIRGISLSVQHGEILGIFGLMGAGRSELLRCIWGLDEMDGGDVFVEGEHLQFLSPIICIKNGMAFLTENRGHEGLLLDKSVEENLVLTNLRILGRRFGFINYNLQAEMCMSMVSKLNIRTYNARVQTVRKLSGGNQQKTVLGKWLLTKPSIFLMDEPTRGIDVGAKAEIYELINQLAEAGNAIVMVSSEMEELMGVCNRILVVHKGKISGSLNRNEFTQEHLLQLAFGS